MTEAPLSVRLSSLGLMNCDTQTVEIFTDGYDSITARTITQIQIINIGQVTNSFVKFFNNYRVPYENSLQKNTEGIATLTLTRPVISVKGGQSTNKLQNKIIKHVEI